MTLKEDALRYHSEGRKGKIEVVPTKPCLTQRDLSLAYTPGVAEPCWEIEKDPYLSYSYTARGNLVAVISNGTAVLGLGNIGPEAAKPVMEGKAVLFKRFADVDVFDIEVREMNPDKLIDIVASLEPTFGGINLEDIRAPECFYIEEELKKRMKIPVFHDDQHGTAIIAGAGFINALELFKKDIKKVKIVFSGAGAASIATAKMFVTLGADIKNIWLVDTKGLVTKDRKNLEKYRGQFAQDTKKRTLEDAMEGADVFVGLSVKGLVTKEMVKSMAEKPIIFAMANPDPEISPEDVLSVRKDAIIATGRSDYPNQVNNVLGFPFIFRGALDVEATQINEEMKVAASKALAKLAKEDVSNMVLKAYGLKKIKFGPEYIIPKPIDPRVLLWVAPAVAKAAIDSGVARKPFKSVKEYVESLDARLGKSREVMRPIINQAKTKLTSIVFPEGSNPEIIKAVRVLADEGICRPILIGNAEEIKTVAANQGTTLDLEKISIIDPATSALCEAYVPKLYEMRMRKGMVMRDARETIVLPHYFGLMMVKSGEADGMVAGIGRHYVATMKPALQLIGVKKGFKKVAGMYVLVSKQGVFFFSDVTVNIDPTSEELAEIAINSADFVKHAFHDEPRIAMLSFANFGSTQHPRVEKVQQAVEIVRVNRPDLMIDGAMQADTAVVKDILEKNYPFSKLKGPANVLIFPSLEAANSAYKLCARLGNAEAIGPILIGMAKPVNILQHSATETEVINLAAITAVEAQ
ncbi:MAG: malic enzyme [Deltaproteobacteria bacterium RIFCSPLOWO2_02_FULL_47_10]|nr:MAG: malic enzyme [Deltaproteobacteria bacterium RIFCSPLOWO2_02_FULL_47_10]